MNSVTVVIGDIALVMAASLLLGTIARRLGQPVIIGQIVAGVLLGHSMPGRLTGHLFPQQVLPDLTALSQIAVVVFMFAVGYETKFRPLRGDGKAVPLIAGISLAVPMGIGMACVLLLRPEFAAIGEVHTDRSFVLFMGVAMSITALPVLAAVVRERGLAGTTAGDVATGAASIMDALAWLILAAALIGTGHSGRFPWLETLLLTGCFVAVMLGAVRPALSWWTTRSPSVLANPVHVAFALAMASAWVTSTLGLQPAFGGFLAGLVLRGRNREPDSEVIRSMDQAGSLLLPVFFIVTGLGLNVGALHGDAVFLLVVILVVACTGKLVPTYLVSRACGLAPRESFTIATLINMRGLTELIALNIGLNDGIIKQQLFTILVLMALITTIAMSPLTGLGGSRKLRITLSKSETIAEDDRVR